MVALVAIFVRVFYALFLCVGPCKSALVGGAGKAHYVPPLRVGFEPTREDPIRFQV